MARKIVYTTVEWLFRFSNVNICRIKMWYSIYFQNLNFALMALTIWRFYFYRHEFLNHYLGGGQIFQRAKRSLTSSFDQLLKRKASKDDFGIANKENNFPSRSASVKVGAALYFCPWLYLYDVGLTELKTRSFSL